MVARAQSRCHGPSFKSIAFLLLAFWALLWAAAGLLELLFVDFGVSQAQAGVPGHSCNDLARAMRFGLLGLVFVVLAFRSLIISDVCLQCMYACGMDR